MAALNENLTADVGVASIGNVNHGVLDQICRAPVPIIRLHNGAQWVIRWDVPTVDGGDDDKAVTLLHHLQGLAFQFRV